MDIVTLGTKIRIARKATGMTQSKVCEAADLSNNYYSAIERGVKIPKLGTLLRIAKVLNVTPNDLLLDDFISKDQILKQIFLTDNLDGLTKAEFRLIYDTVVSLSKRLKTVREANQKELIIQDGNYLLEI